MSMVPEMQYQKVIDLLRDCVSWMSKAEVKIDGEWGLSRTFEEIQAAGEISAELMAARAFLKNNP